MSVETFSSILAQAVKHFAEQGFTSKEDLELWIKRIKAAAVASLVPERVLEERLKASFQVIFKRLVDRGGLLRWHRGVERYTLEKVKPHLRDELARQVFAAADLIKLNREQAIAKTLARFSGWATSVPAGGSKVVSKVDTKEQVKKAMASLPYEERRVLVDQGQKFISNLSALVATDNGAIAYVWEHHYSLHPRESHVERAGDVYLIRGSWVHLAGFAKPGKSGYSDEVEKPGQFIFCRCTADYLYGLSELPDNMLTKRGKEELERIRK
jgi:hypothetical protein